MTTQTTARPFVTFRARLATYFDMSKKEQMQYQQGNYIPRNVAMTAFNLLMRQQEYAGTGYGVKLTPDSNHLLLIHDNIIVVSVSIEPDQRFSGLLLNLDKLDECGFDIDALRPLFNEE